MVRRLYYCVRVVRSKERFEELSKYPKLEPYYNSAVDNPMLVKLHVEKPKVYAVVNGGLP